MNRFTVPVTTAKNGHRIFSILAGSAHLHLRIHGEGGKGQAPSPPLTTGHPMHMAGHPVWVSKSLNVGKDPKRHQLLCQLMIAVMVTCHVSTHISFYNEWYSSWKLTPPRGPCRLILQMFKWLMRAVFQSRDTWNHQFSMFYLNLIIISRHK